MEPIRLTRTDEPAAVPERSVPRAPALDLRSPTRLVAYLSRAPVEQRRGVIGGLQASIGNRRVTAMLQRTPAPVAPAAPAALPQGALQLLEKMGVSGDKVAGLTRGEMLAIQTPAEGGEPTITLLQIRGGTLRGGILAIKVPNDPKLAVRAFFRARQPLLDLARELNLSEVELLGAAIHHKGIQEMVVRLGFTPTTETIPESAGLGGADEVEMWSKRFPVHSASGGGTGGAGGGAAGGGVPPGEAPPAAGGAAPARGAAPAGGGQAPPEPAAAAEAAPEVAAMPPVEGPAIPGGARGMGGEPPLAGGSLGLGALRLGGSLAVMVALWWLSSRLAGAERERVEQMFKANVDPFVQVQLAARREEAERLALADPLKPVYAVITADIRSSGFTGAFGSSETVLGVTFVSVDGVAQTPVRREETIEDHTTGGMYDAVAKQVTRRVTYSMELAFDDPTGAFAQRRQAILADRRAQGAAAAEAKLVQDAQQHADAHKSARGRSIMIGDRDENIRWIRAYIAYSAQRLDLQELHDEAQRYLDELEGRPHRWPDQSQAKSLEPFMSR
jgi:hypothetical protein